MADELTKQDADVHFIRPERFFVVLKRQLKQDLQDWKENLSTTQPW